MYIQEWMYITYLFEEIQLIGGQLVILQHFGGYQHIAGSIRWVPLVLRIRLVQRHV